MAITRVQFKYGAQGEGVSTTTATGNMTSSVTSGNLLVVIVRFGENNTVSSLTDTLGNTYTLHASALANDPCIAIYSAVSGSSGTNAVTLTTTADGWYTWVAVAEYSPGGNTWSTTAATRLDTGGARFATAGTTDLTTNAFSTAQAEEVVVVGASTWSNGTMTAGTDFTLIEGGITDGVVAFGAVEEYITGGTLSTYTAHITGGASGDYVIAWGAFKTDVSAVTCAPGVGAVSMTGLVPSVSVFNQTANDALIVIRQA